MRGFVNGMLAGVIPRDALLTAGRLISLGKPEGRILQIAIGEAFFGWPASVGWHACPTLVPPSPPGRQAWASREALRSLDTCRVRTSCAMTLSRSPRPGEHLQSDEPAQAREPPAEALPRAALNFRMKYSERNLLLTYRPNGTTSVLQSETGVRQGDPLDPLIFAAAFPPTRSRRRRPAHRMRLWWLATATRACRAM